MIGSNISVKNDKHVDACVSMSLAMLEVTKKMSFEMKRDIQIRIGIATGPVVAGIIGIQNRVYDVYGNTVNLASRMETSTFPNTIQLSEESALRVKKSKNYKVTER